MYFPYFRGRQYELLALRELADKGLITTSVIPVIEPIKNSSTLTSTLAAFRKAGLQVALILNPAVGGMSKDIKLTAPLYDYLGDGLIPSLIANNEMHPFIDVLNNKGIGHECLLTILDSRDEIDAYKEIFDSNPPKFTLFPDERQIRRTVENGKVLFEDKFNKQARNADYLDKEDEFFSEDHIYFKDEGYDGFGDYSIIGNEYSEAGFAPYAVAIHIVYFKDDNKGDKILRVRRFVSDSNEDISDVAGKFYEAVSKLVIWYRSGQEKQETEGLKILVSHYDNGTYPGLPTLKKLSVMHHLELVGKFLDGRL